jgi:hypothetical protein
MTLNGKREASAERCNDWLSGKSFEGLKPMGGCGAK